jgi:hypothetical protein
VDSAFGHPPVGACEAGNSDGNLRISVDEILKAINAEQTMCATG